MLRSGSILLLFVSLFGCAPRVQPGRAVTFSLPASEEYIGLRHPPLPAGLSDQAGYLINPDGEIEYAVAYIARKSGGMLWLERLTHRNPLGHPFFEVRAVLSLPPLSNQDSLIFGQCRLDGAIDPEIIAIVAETDAEIYREIRQAWRASREGERFEPLPVDRLACINESYGT